MSDLGFTHIYEAVRKKMDLSRDEYALCNYIQVWASYPGSTRSGWCNRTQTQMAEFIGITDRGIRKMLQRLIDLNLLEKDSLTSHTRITKAWFEEVTKARDRIEYQEQSSSLYAEQSSGSTRNKVPDNAEQSSGSMRNKVPTHNKSFKGGLESKNIENCAPSFLSVQIFESRTETLEINETENDTQFRRRGSKNGHTAEEIAANLKGPELEFYVDILNSGAWPDYLLYRKEIRVKPYRSAKSEAEAICDFFKEAGGKSEIAQAIVNQSRAKGWTGLFKLKSDRSNDNGNNVRHNTNPGNGGDFFGGGDSPFFQGVK